MDYSRRGSNGAHSGRTRGAERGGISPQSPRCLHCRIRAANRPRGLCYLCYFTDGVREQYPLLRRDVPMYYTTSGVGRLPRMPTSALPGTSEKVAVMMERVSVGESPFHPEDATNESRIGGRDSVA